MLFVCDLYDTHLFRRKREFMQTPAAELGAVHNCSGKVCVTDFSPAEIRAGQVGVLKINRAKSGEHPGFRVRDAAVARRNAKAGVGKISPGKIRFMYLTIPQIRAAQTGMAKTRPV